MSSRVEKVRGALRRTPQERLLTEFAAGGDRHRRIVELAPHGIALLGLDGLILDVNPAIERLLGRPRDEIVGHSCLPFTHPEDHERELPMLTATLAGEREGYALEKRYVRRDGSPIWARLSLTLIRDDAGRPSHLLALIEDIDERHQLDLALRESESRYRSIFHESGSGIVLLTPGGVVVQANGALAAMLGHERRELKGRTLAELVDPRAERYERRFARPDGRVVHVEVRLTAIRDDGGTTRYLLAIVDDVSEQRRLGDDLRRSRDDLRLALDGARAGIWTWTVATGDVRWSENLERIHGLEPGSFGGRVEDVLEEVHPRDLDRVSEAIRATLEDGEEYHVEYRIVRPDGELAWLEAVGRIERDSEGELQLTGVCMDVSERHRLEEERRSADEMLRNLIAASPLAIVSLDRHARVLLWNAAAERTYGWRADEAIGRRLPTIPDAEWPTFERDLEAQFDDRSQHRGTEVVRLRKDGSTVEIAVWTSRLRDRNGDVVATLSIHADLSQRKQLEQQLAQAARLEGIGKLAGGVAHDFNNLLTVISGYADVLLRSGGLSPHVRRELTQIRLAASRAAEVVGQLLAFSRQQVLAPTLLDLNEVAAEVEQMLRHVIGEDVRLRVVPSDEPLPVLADRAQLAQVLVNLAVNARDAMPAGGSLEIRCDRDGGLARIRVTDTGSGMDEPTRLRVFEPFFTTKEPGRGTGLGLATSYGIVTQSGGSITVESELGAGTIVTILLPGADGISAREAPAPPPEPRRGDVRGSTVLLVEDEPLLRELVVEMLRSVAVSVLDASTADEAIERCADHPGAIDALITDLVMPGMSGRGLAEALTALRPGLRVLYVSGYPDEEIAARGILEPGMTFLQKPFTLEQLEAALCSLLAGAPA
jgi:PAS domain S-box-containing protein